MSGYLHESGHIISNTLSFLNNNVLLPDEAKTTIIPLKPMEQFRVVRGIIFNKKEYMNQFEEKLAKRILGVFTKGNYDFSKIKLVSLDNEQLEKVKEHIALYDRQNVTYDIDNDGNVIPINTQIGVLRELPAYAVSKACMTILFNSISSKDFVFVYKEGETRGSHAEAMKIVQKAYSRTGQVLPSSVDLDKIVENYLEHCQD